MANLNEAVQLIRQGHKGDARRILEPILKANPQDIQAWFWYVETFSTLEQRIKTLEICLRLNPGNPQALRALRALQARSENPPPAPPPTTQNEIPAWARRPAPEPVSPPVIPQPASSPASSPTSAFAFDEPEPEPPLPPTGATGGGWQQPRGESKPAFDWDTLEKESAPVGAAATEAPLPQAPESPPRGRSLPFYRVWWRAFSTQSVAGYAYIFDDPEAGAGRAFEWMAYTSVVTGLFLPLVLVSNPLFAELLTSPEIQELFGRIDSTMMPVVMGLSMAVFAPILSVIGLAINSWLYNLLAVLFGGRGTFGRTAYALAAYLAPFSLLTTFLNSIPVVGSCLVAPLGIYSIVLNVRALMAAYDLPLGRALGVILLPGILLFVLFCLLGILF